MDVDGAAMEAAKMFNQVPADTEELRRRDALHFASAVPTGGLYVAEQQVREALAPKPDRQSAILDLGSGTGYWAISMAHEFPHAQVVGIDLTPATRELPSNCRFEVNDFTRSLVNHYNSYDFVHARFIFAGVKDYKALIQDATRCLRPGGILMMLEPDFPLKNEFCEPQLLAYENGDLGASWTARAFDECHKQLTAKGINVKAAANLESWMKDCPELENVGSQPHRSPVGPWDKSGDTDKDRRRMEIAGVLTCHAIKESLRMIIPMLAANGLQSELLDKFTTGSDKELDDLSVRMYFQWRSVWGRKVSSSSVPGAAMA